MSKTKEFIKISSMTCKPAIIFGVSTGLLLSMPPLILLTYMRLDNVRNETMFKAIWILSTPFISIIIASIIIALLASYILNGLFYALRNFGISLNITAALMFGFFFVPPTLNFGISLFMFFFAILSGADTIKIALNSFLYSITNYGTKTLPLFNHPILYGLVGAIAALVYYGFVKKFFRKPNLALNV